MLTHLDSENRPLMVDVSEKEITARVASARAFVQFPAEILKSFDGQEMHTKKGPVLATAIIAGTMAVKKTSDLIPFCHPLLIENCKFETNWLKGQGVEIICRVQTRGKTGVEMEALTGASIAALTVYDMCKALSQEIEISQVCLLQKEGGKSDFSRDASRGPSPG